MKIVRTSNSTVFDYILHLLNNFPNNWKVLYPSTNMIQYIYHDSKGTSYTVIMDHTTVVPKFFKDEVRIIFTKLTKEQVEKMTEALNILAVSREPEDKVIDLMELLNDHKV